MEEVKSISLMCSSLKLFCHVCMQASVYPVWGNQLRLDFLQTRAVCEVLVLLQEIIWAVISRMLLTFLGHKHDCEAWWLKLPWLHHFLHFQRHAYVLSWIYHETSIIRLSSANISFAKYFVMRTPTPPSWAAAGNGNPSLLCSFALHSDTWSSFH